MKRRRGNLLLVLSLVIVVAGLAVGVWALRAFPTEMPIRQSEPPVSTTQAPPVTEPVREPEPPAIAEWTPQARELTRKSALLVTPTPQEAAAAAELGFRSLILDLGFTDFAAGELERAQALLEPLGGENIYRALAVTPTCMSSFDCFAEAAMDEEALAAFQRGFSGLISMASFDAVVLREDCAADPEGEVLIAFTQALTGTLEQAGLELPILFEVDGKQAESDAYIEKLLALVESIPGAELLVRTAGAAAEPLHAWKKLLPADAKTPITALVEMGSALGRGSLNEMASLFTAFDKLRGYGLAFAGAIRSLSDEQANDLLQLYYKDELDVNALTRKLRMQKPFTDLQAKQSISTAVPEINFTGSSSPIYPLLCNGKEMPRNEGGDFSVDYHLEPGLNSFVFEHQGEAYQVDVTYKVKVLEKVRPNSSVETTGGVDFVVTAIARRDAKVTATLGGNTITLRPGGSGGEDGSTQEEEGLFITYEGTFHLPESGSARKSLGYVDVTATYQGIKDTMSGAKVVLLPKEAPPPPEPPTTEAATTTTTTKPSATGTQTSTGTKTSTNPSTGTGTNTSTNSSTSSGVGTSVSGSNTSTVASSSTGTTTGTQSTSAPLKALLTPYEYAGRSGKSRMAEVITDYANAKSNSVLDENSIPRSSPLLKGTFDYVTGSDTVDGTKYYHLKSGKRVAKNDLKIIEDGYNLPLSELRAAASLKNGVLELRFGVDWKIPFNVDLTGQNYISSNGYKYGVNSYAATGLEIVFYQTKSYGGSADPGNSGLIKSAEWSRSSTNDTVTLKLAFAKAAGFYGYQAVYEGNELVIRISPKPPAALKGAVIILDPGHGGKEVGSNLAVSHETLKYEKQINLLLAKKIKAKLEAQGATVYMTRTEDVSVSLEERTAMQRRINPDLFISIHCDSWSSGSAMGTSAFYYRAYSFPLADAIHKRIVSTYKDKIYTNGNYSNASTLRSNVDRLTKFYPFFVNRVEECPSVLIEYGFGSNLTECKVLQKDSYQDLLAQATVDGILDYLKGAQ